MTYTYHGDLNIENGGMFLDFQEFERARDYIPVVRITDLDSGCGFDNAVLIETGTIYIPEDKEKRKSALSCTGYDSLSSEEITPLMLVESFEACWGIERDYYQAQVCIQTKPDGPMEFDGWKADKEWSENFWQSGISLKEFIESEFVKGN